MKHARLSFHYKLTDIHTLNIHVHKYMCIINICRFVMKTQSRIYFKKLWSVLYQYWPLKLLLCPTSHLPVRVSECGESFVVVDVGGGDGGEHGGPRVAAQVLPQQPGQHRVSVGDEVVLLLLFVGSASAPSASSALGIGIIIKKFVSPNRFVKVYERTKK